MQLGAIASFSLWTFSIISSNVLSLKLTFVTVVNNPSIIILSVLSDFSLWPQDLASPITAPVNSSCNLDVLAVFPQTPAAPIHPAQPAVCSH